MQLNRIRRNIGTCDQRNTVLLGAIRIGHGFIEFDNAPRGGRPFRDTGVVIDQPANRDLHLHEGRGELHDFAQR